SARRRLPRLSTNGSRSIWKSDLRGVEAMLTREDVIEKLKNGELTPQDIAANGWMCSVTQRIGKIKQPRGGYLKPKEFEQTVLDGGGIDDLYPEENVSPGLVGLA